MERERRWNLTKSFKFYLEDQTCKMCPNVFCKVKCKNGDLDKTYIKMCNKVTMIKTVYRWFQNRENIRTE